MKKSALLAGAASGVVGLFVFLGIHHLWIVPIWFILPIGLPIAIAAGSAVGWAYAELEPHLPARPWTSMALVGLIAVILLPGLVLAELRAPMFDLSGPGGAVLLVSPRRAGVIFVVELLVTATLAGCLLGWLIGRSRRAVVSAGVAGSAFALGPGHNIPFGGGTPGVGKQLAIIAAVTAVSALVLVEGWWVARRVLTRQ